MASPSITLYRGFPSSLSYVWSPFATKLEARLRFGGLAYKTDQGAPPRSPRGKIPYIAIAKDGDTTTEMLSDSTLISEKLVTDGLAENLNSTLTALEKAQDLAIRALLEDKLYFYQGYERWEQNYYTMRPKVLGALPYPVQVIVGQLAYRKMTATLWGQGTTRFTPEEITKFKTEVWENIDALLTASSRKRGSSGPDGMFFVLGGEGPTDADTTLFGFIASGLVCAALGAAVKVAERMITSRAPETRKIIRSFPTIMDYADKIHNHYFPNCEHWE